MKLFSQVPKPYKLYPPEVRRSSGVALWEPAFEALHVRYVERVPLGTPYAAVVEYVRRVQSHAQLWKHRQLVVDATGLGAPVVEMLRQAGLECQM